MSPEILRIKKDREQLLIELFCDQGARIDDTGEVHGVCRSVPFEQMLEFQSQTIALVLEAVGKE